MAGLIQPISSQRNVVLLLEFLSLPGGFQLPSLFVAVMPNVVVG